MKNIAHSVYEVLRSHRGVSLFVLFVVAVVVVISYIHPLLLLNNDRIFYLFSTSAQVVAAIYGLTLTGYVFFREILDKKKQDDDSLDGLVDELLKRYYKYISCITVLTFAAIILCFVTIAYEKGVFLNAFINVSVSAVVCDLFFILFFVILIMCPNSIAQISNTILKKKNTGVGCGGQNKGSEFDGDDGGNQGEAYYHGGNKPQGDSCDGGKEKNDNEKNIVLFMEMYQKIEKMLDCASRPFVFKRFEGDNRKLPNRTLTNILMRKEFITKKLKEDLDDLIVYRNGLIHGSIPMCVPIKYVEKITRCENELETVLEKKNLYDEQFLKPNSVTQSN